MIGTGTDGVTQRLGLTRTFLPWFPQGSVTPVSLAWLWPVTSRPDRGLAGLQLSEQTAAEMAAGGRLDRIINNAGDSRITWVFDPCVLQTAEDMVDGYSVATGPASSQSTAGAGALAAEQWLAAARRSASKQQSVATPVRIPDATALQRAGMDKTVTQSTATAAAEVAASTRASVSGVLAAGGQDHHPLDQAHLPRGWGDQHAAVRCHPAVRLDVHPGRFHHVGRDAGRAGRLWLSAALGAHKRPAARDYSPASSSWPRSP